MEETTEITKPVLAALHTYLDEKFGGGNYVYSIQEATKKGDNYMGIVYRISITPSHKGSKILKFILKVPPQNLLRRNQFFARPGFLRESLAYEEFLPLASAFQKTKSVLNSDAFYEYPTCYFSLTDKYHEAIFMEDLRESGYHMHDRFKPLGREEVALIMIVYGKLHATTLAIKDQNPEKLSNLKHIVDIFVQRKDDPQLNDYFESLKVGALDSLDRDVDKAYWSKLKEYFSKGTFYELMLSLLDSKSSEPYAVICHGDCWINNIMFRQENGKICDARLIDWQIMRYASPVIDLMYFLMSSTTKDFRDKHFDEMLHVYHTAAAEHLKRLGSIPDVLYPRSALDLELKSKGAIGLLLAMIVLPILTTKSEDIPDLEKLSEKVSLGQSTDALEAGFIGARSAFFNERMRGVILSSIDWDLV